MSLKVKFAANKIKRTQKRIDYYNEFIAKCEARKKKARGWIKEEKKEYSKVIDSLTPDELEELGLITGELK